jgi:peptide/nickel transport system permease protein
VTVLQETGQIAGERHTDRRTEVIAVAPLVRARGRLRADPVGLIAAGVLGGLVLGSLAAPLIAPYGPYSGAITDRLLTIGAPGHLLGTDQEGRDILSRILYGGRITLISGVTPVLVATLIGGTIGAIAGHFGGIVGGSLMRFMDIFYAFPSILLAIGIAAALGPGVSNAIIALSIIFIPPLTRVTEAAVRTVEARPFMEAARAGGAGSTQIILRQVVPNAAVPVGVYASTLFGISILFASGLSYLGLGVQAPTPEWGQMLNELKDTMYNGSFVSVIPGLAIFLACLSFNLSSDAIRDALDPETRR